MEKTASKKKDPTKNSKLLYTASFSIKLLKGKKQPEQKKILPKMWENRKMRKTLHIAWVFNDLCGAVF